MKHLYDAETKEPRKSSIFERRLSDPTNNRDKNRRFLTLRMMRLSSQVREGHLVNALAYRGDERRDTLR